MRLYAIGWAFLAMAGCGLATAPNSYPQAAGEANRPRELVAGGAAAPPVPASAGEVSTLTRKIIYDGHMQLAVEEFSSIPAKVDRLVAAYGAIVADSSVAGAPGQRRVGRWKLRVPFDRFHDFVEEARKLGELISEGKSSQDISEKYYDLQARIKNKKLQEERLLKMMRENAMQLDDLLKLEEHVTRVRGEIEQMEGQLRVLTDMTDLATFTLSIQEIRGYKPPEAPTFGTRISRAWQDSVQGLLTVGQGLVLFAVAAAPWLPLALAPALVVYAMWRRLRPKATSVETYA